jgi:predicted nucleic acid-binding protein
MSYRFLQEVKGMGIFCPTLVLSECGAAIARPTGHYLLSRRLVSLIRHFPGVTQVPLDYSLALRAAEIAIENRLRGADTVYVAGQTFNLTTQVTLSAKTGVSLLGEWHVVKR